VDAKRIVAALLIPAGVLGLVYGGFSYTTQTHKARIGPLDLSVKEKERVNVPMREGVADRLLPQ